MPVAPPITTNGRFFPPQSALYRIERGYPKTRKMPNMILLSNNLATADEQCIRAAPLASLKSARWFRSLRARVWLEEDVSTLPADLYVACACPEDILARTNNTELATGASLQDLCEGIELFARKNKESNGQRVRVAWAELRRDGLTAWCCLQAV